MLASFTRSNFNIQRLFRTTVFTQRNFSDTKSIEYVVPVREKELSLTPDSNSKITIYGPVNIASVNGVPEEHLKERLVRIYQTPKNAMQSGTNNANCWEMEFDTRKRWENPLMGWCSSGDPHSNLKLQFIDKESAINFAEKNGYQWFVEPKKKEAPKVKSYGFNFSWNKRSRVSTK